MRGLNRATLIPCYGQETELSLTNPRDAFVQYAMAWLTP